MLALAALPSQANEGFVAYEPGAVKAAVERQVCDQNSSREEQDENRCMDGA